MSRWVTNANGGLINLDHVMAIFKKNSDNSYLIRAEDIRGELFTMYKFDNEEFRDNFFNSIVEHLTGYDHE